MIGQRKTIWGKLIKTAAYRNLDNFLRSSVNMCKHMLWCILRVDQKYKPFAFNSTALLQNRKYAIKAIFIFPARIVTQSKPGCGQAFWKFQRENTHWFHIYSITSNYRIESKPTKQELGFAILKFRSHILWLHTMKGRIMSCINVKCIIN